MSTSQNIYAIKDRAPEFPCWVWDTACEHWSHRTSIDDGFTRLDLHNERLTHWKTDRPVAETPTPSLPASPSPVAGLPTPESGEPRACPICQNDGFWVDVQPNRHTGDAEQVQVECEFCSTKNALAAARAEVEAAQQEANQFKGIAKDRLAQLATAKEAVTRVTQQHIADAESHAEELTSLRSELAKANAAVERLKQGAEDTAAANHAACADGKAEEIAAYFIDTILKTEWDKDHMTRVLEGWLANNLAPLRAQLATAKEERDQLKEFCTKRREEIADLQASLAKANAAVEKAQEQIAHDLARENTLLAELADLRGSINVKDRCNLELSEQVRAQEGQITSLRFSLAAANAAVEEAKQQKTELDGLKLSIKMHNEQIDLPLTKAIVDGARENRIEFVGRSPKQIVEALLAQLAAQQPVPPEARAVEAARKLFPELCTGLSDDTAEFMRKAQTIQRTCFPPGEGEEWAKAAIEEINETAFDTVGTESILNGKRAVAIILKHFAARPTAAREEVRKAAEELATVRLPSRINLLETRIEHIIAILAKHGLGVSEDTAAREDTARLDWLEAKWERLNESPSVYGFGDQPAANIADLRAAIDAAMQQGGKTP